MDNDILIIPEDDRFIYIAFVNSEGEIEYTKYENVDGGFIDSQDSDISAVIAEDNDFIDYLDYKLVVIGE